jgi:hypothetical protein
MAFFTDENTIEPGGAPVATAVRASRKVSVTATEAMPVVAVPDAATAGSRIFARKEREPVAPDEVAQRHGLYMTEARGTRSYFADHQQKQPVMQADAKRITTKAADAPTVTAMLDLAQSRGWDTVKLRGSPDFRREAWVQAQTRGLTAEGYKPTDTDKQEVQRRGVRVSASAQPVATASAQPVATASAQHIASPAAAAVKAAPARAAPAAPQPGVKPTAEWLAAQEVKQAAYAASRPASVARPPEETPAQRSKAAWGAVEAVGKQARANDVPIQAVTAKAGEHAPAAAKPITVAAA